MNRPTANKPYCVRRIHHRQLKSETRYIARPTIVITERKDHLDTLASRVL